MATKEFISHKRPITAPFLLYISFTFTGMVFCIQLSKSLVSITDALTSNSYMAPSIRTPKPIALLVNEVDDEELLRRASLVSPETSGCRKKKVAFMFLTRGRLPLRRLWETFFDGHDGFFSIYLHTSPNYKEEGTPLTSVFFNRKINSQEVQWGSVSMADAERRLIANALLDDECNDRFLLLSESCIPLHNFTTIYTYLTTSNQSHIESFDHPGRTTRGRYNSSMFPTIDVRHWRKGSQWFELQRHLAVEIVADSTYYPLFRRHCFSPCYIDEHYLPTWVTMVAPEMNSGRSVTWVDWSKGGSHPATFHGRQVSKTLLRKMRGGKCNNETFLFARKFVGSTLGPLLRIAPKFMGFGPFDYLTN